MAAPAVVDTALRATSVYFIRLWRSGKSTVLISALNPLFVLAAMGVGLGSLIDTPEQSSLGGVDYLTFLAPALMAAFAMQSAVGGSLWPVLGGIKWEGTFVAQTATPLRPADVLHGHLAYITAEIATNVVFTLFAMVVFGAVESPWGVLAVPAAVLTGLVYATAVTGFSATQETDSAFPLIMRFGVIPSYLFSGTFFPVDQLPTGLEWAAKVTPLWHGVDLCRDLVLGDAGLASSLVHVAYLALLLALALWWARGTFRRRLHA
jgi:lipooligosaccharide transport system permease protein